MAYFGSKATSARWRSALSLAATLGLLGCSDDGDNNAAQGDSGQPSAVVTGQGDGGTNASDAGAQQLGPVSADGLVVAISSGRVKGKLVDATREFLGIPYGKAERFAAPKAPDKWEGERDATMHGPSCAQAMGTLSPAMGGFSEDCLSINVYTPKQTSATGLPVHVFIHGGAFISGGSSQYDGQKLSERGPLVVVTLNYRLGVFGFLSHPALDAARSGEPTGNDAIRDQQLALKWIKDNIAAFGGDPNKVTISGESAGAMSACLHLVSPRSSDLGQRFIFQSGVCTGGGNLMKTKAEADALGKRLADELCAGQSDLLGCLRGKTREELADWGKGSMFGPGFGPVINAADPVLPDQPIKLVREGKFNKGAILLGTNLKEWGLFQALGSPKPANVAELNTALEMQFAATLGAGLALVKDHYKPADDAGANDAYVRAVTDAAFRCPTRALARLASEKGSKVYLYSFEHGLAYHAYEIPYVFGNPNALLAPVLDEPTVMAVQGYWMAFATSGDPNGRMQPMWPAYSAAADQSMTLKGMPALTTGHAKADCDFWDNLIAAGMQP